jgi:hypothetical protein
VLLLQVEAPPSLPPSGKGAEYRPSFADDLLLAFFRAKMVEVSSIDPPVPLLFST